MKSLQNLKNEPPKKVFFGNLANVTNLVRFVGYKDMFANNSFNWNHRLLG